MDPLNIFPHIFADSQRFQVRQTFNRRKVCHSAVCHIQLPQFCMCLYAGKGDKRCIPQLQDLQAIDLGKPMQVL